MRYLFTYLFGFVVNLLFLTACFGVGDIAPTSSAAAIGGLWATGLSCWLEQRQRGRPIKAAPVLAVACYALALFFGMLACCVNRDDPRFTLGSCIFATLTAVIGTLVGYEWDRLRRLPPAGGDNPR
jgi:hypothetical protein